MENLDGILTDWVDEPIGTASIGQVYKACWQPVGSLLEGHRCVISKWFTVNLSRV